MPRRKYIPFRGDDYSKEASKNYIYWQKSSCLERIFVSTILIVGSGLIFFVTGISAGWTIQFFFASMIFLSLLTAIGYFAYKDAKKIGEKDNSIDDEL